MLTVTCLLPPPPSPPAGQSNACWWYGCSRICYQCQHSLCVRACLSTANTSIAEAGMSAALPPSCSLLQVKVMLAGAMAAAVCVISADQCIHEGLSAGAHEAGAGGGGGS
jgi:hypothetical protein